ncbi:MAG: hypothetical protein GX575_07355, partial [Candidatus Anammoximicrobium sp.]|nr:hypothetical protein [Candidatus Anammoximicrobium sp.]
MQLSSVRELKSDLLETILPALSASVRSRGVPGAGVQRQAAATDRQPTLALGIARHTARDFALAVRVQQRALENSREVDRITRQARGEVDVRYVGVVRTRAVPWYQQRCRPLRIGCSVGHFKVTAGTLGAVVRPCGGGPLAILSNNHVLACENRGQRGDAILQPGTYDGGAAPDDTVATLADFVKVKRSGVNTVDAAVATLVKEIEADPAKLTGMGRLKGLGEEFLDEGAAVAKLGRTTGRTRGRVTAFELDNVQAEFGIGVLRFDDQIEIEGDGDGPFSDGGDSGSLIVNADRRAVALLFAGSDQGGANGQGLARQKSRRAAGRSVFVKTGIFVLLSPVFVRGGDDRFSGLSR